MFWVHGGTKNTFIASYRSIADTLDLPGRHEPKVDVLALVRDWLHSADHGPWLLILDNADDVETFFAKDEPVPLAAYLPKAGHGKILVTSRSLTAAEKLVGTHRDIMRLPKMDNSQAMQLFRTKLDVGWVEAPAAALVQALDSVPLAIAQAAAYINHRAPRESIESYLRRFSQGAEDKNSLLNFDGGDLQRYEGVSNSVVVTWQVTFEQICRERITAAKLLALMSFFQPNDIPENTLAGYASVKLSEDDPSDDECESFEDDLDVLRAFSLVDMSALVGHCEMHPLVQFCTQRWLSTRSDVSLWETLFLEQVTESFLAKDGRNNPKQWHACQILLSHVGKLLAGSEPSNLMGALWWAALNIEACGYLLAIGDVSKASRLAEDAVRVWSSILGPDDRGTLTAMGILAGVYRVDGRWAESVELNQRVAEHRKLKLGPRHPDTLVVLNNLATAYQSQGLWKEAEEVLLPIWEVVQTKFEPGRPLGDDLYLVLSCVNNLASTYQYQGRSTDAERLQVIALEMSKAELGPEHPLTLVYMANLADLYNRQDRLPEAEKLGGQVLEMQEAVLGPDHPDTLNTMLILAETYRKQLRWPDSESLNLQVIKDRRERLGHTHRDTLLSMSLLARIYIDQNRWMDAEKILKQVVQSRGAQNEVDYYANPAKQLLAVAVYNLGRLDEAITLMNEAVQIRQRVLGAEHHDTQNAMRDLEYLQGQKPESNADII